MMARLILYVANHRCTVRFAYAKGAIAALPCEVAPFRPTLLQPSGGVRFYHAHAIRECQIGRQPREEVEMIRGSPDCDGYGFELSEDSADVSMHIGSGALGKKRRAARGRKDNVRKQVCKRVAHFLSPLRGYDLQAWRSTPGLHLGLPSCARYAGWCGPEAFTHPQAHAWGYRLMPAARAGQSAVREVCGSLVAFPANLAQPDPSPRRRPRAAPAQVASAPARGSSN